MKMLLKLILVFVAIWSPSATGFPMEDQPHGVCPAESDKSVVLPDKIDCQKYYVCTNGTLVTQYCFPGQVWNVKVGRCDFPSNTECMQPIQEKEDDKDSNSGSEEEKSDSSSKEANSSEEEQSGDSSKEANSGEEGKSGDSSKEANSGEEEQSGDSKEENSGEAGKSGESSKEANSGEEVKSGDSSKEANSGEEVKSGASSKEVNSGEEEQSGDSSKEENSGEEGKSGESSKEAKSGEDEQSKENSEEFQLVGPCADQSANNFLPDRSDCNKYFVCSEGVPISMTCPGVLRFNAEREICDWPQNVNCKGATTDPENNQCANMAEGQFVADKTNCQHYYQCIGGVAQMMKCPSILQFNAGLNVCDWPENVKC